jgi:hypothetical protein
VKVRLTTQSHPNSDIEDENPLSDSVNASTCKVRGTEKRRDCFDPLAMTIS